MKLFKYEGFRVVVSEEALLLKPFKLIWNRDRSASKDKALSELGFIYFFCDPRSDYQHYIDEDERTKAIKQGEGLSENWKPDKIILEAIELYKSFKPTSALLLEDIRFVIDNLRKTLRAIDFSSLEVKELKDIQTIIKQTPSLVKDLDEAERSVAREMAESSRKRGGGEKSMLEMMNYD